jgi:uncharacterized protein YaaN involved in tellurite resistance
MSQTPALLEENLPAEGAERITALAATINLEDPAVSVTFGTETMNNIAHFADGLLEQVRAKDAGPVGNDLTDLMLKVKDVDFESLAADKKGFLESIPVVGSLFNTAERTIAKFKTLSEQVEIITGKLDDAMVGLLRDIEVLEQLYDHNKKFHHDLTVCIEAGKQRLEKARAEELPKLQAEVGDDAMAAQRVRDFAERINRFERRLHDLQISRTITVQTAPQIRLIQNNNQTLAEKIQTGILSTIPIWKSQMVLALSLHGQQKAAALQKSVADTTNDLLRKNAAMLEGAAVETAKQVERSMVDVETLREVHQKLLGTIEETLRIAQEGRERRQSVEKELAGMEDELRTRLTSLAASGTKAAVTHAAGNPQQKALSGQNGK